MLVLEKKNVESILGENSSQNKEKDSKRRSQRKQHRKSETNPRYVKKQDYEAEKKSSR